MNKISIGAGSSFADHMMTQAHVDVKAVADETIRLFLIGRALERNFNEIIVAYERLGMQSEVQAANVVPLDFFDKRVAVASHFVRAICGAKNGEACAGEGRVPTDLYPFEGYFYPYLVGRSEKPDTKPLPLYYQEYFLTNYIYDLSRGGLWLSGPRATNGQEPAAQEPAMDVQTSASRATGPIFAFLDPEYLYTADTTHAAVHPGIIGAGKALSHSGNVGGWLTPLPGCQNQQQVFEAEPAEEKKLFQISQTTAPVLGDATEICDLTHQMSRFVAISLAHDMYLYAVNQAAVDYLAGVRGDFRANVILRLLSAAAARVASQYNTTARYREFIRREVITLSNHPRGR